MLRAPEPSTSSGPSTSATTNAPKPTTARTRKATRMVARGKAATGTAEDGSTGADDAEEGKAKARKVPVSSKGNKARGVGAANARKTRSSTNSDSTTDPNNVDTSAKTDVNTSSTARTTTKTTTKTTAKGEARTKTNVNPKTDSKATTLKKTAKSTIKTPEKAAAGPKGASATAKIKKRGTSTTSKTGGKSRSKTVTTGDSDKTREKDKNDKTIKPTSVADKSNKTSKTTNKGDRIAKASKLDTTDKAGKTSTVAVTNKSTAATTTTSTAITPAWTAANTPKDTTDPSRPIFYPSYFPHIMSNIIAMCDFTDQLKFRSVSRFCQQEAHRVILGPGGSIHAPVCTFGNCWAPCFIHKDDSHGGMPAIPKRLHWTFQVIDYEGPHHYRSDYCSSRLVLAHTVRYSVSSAPIWQTFFPPNLRTVALFFNLYDLHNVTPITSTSHLLNPTADPTADPTPEYPVPETFQAYQSSFPNPSITKVVLNLSPLGDSAAAAAATLDEKWWDRLVMPVSSCPPSVTDLVVVFGILGSATKRSVLRTPNDGRQILWDKLTAALSTMKDTTVTLVDVATVFPSAPDPCDPSIFGPIHAAINSKYRSEPINNLQIMAMTRGEYKAKVGEKQFKLDTEW